jgi:hypothetical protein
MSSAKLVAGATDARSVAAGSRVRKPSDTGSAWSTGDTAMPRKTQDDPKVPEGQVGIRDSGGFVSNEDPHDLPPGTAIQQINV